MRLHGLDKCLYACSAAAKVEVDVLHSGLGGEMFLSTRLGVTYISLCLVSINEV